MDLKLHAIFRVSFTHIWSAALLMFTMSHLYIQRNTIMDPFFISKCFNKNLVHTEIKLNQIKIPKCISELLKKFFKGYGANFPSFKAVHRANFSKRVCINYWSTDIGLKAEGAVSAKKKNLCVKKAKMWLENGI